MSLLISAATIGFFLALMVLGVYVTFRLFDFCDLTTDGSFALGAAVTAVLLTAGVHPAWATLAGAAAGCAAGALTGLLHARMGIHGLLAGILVMTALYSVNLHIMGKSNVPLLSTPTLITLTEEFAARRLGIPENVMLLGWTVALRDVAGLVLGAGVVTASLLLAFMFFRTDLGTAMRATGDNPVMVRALGADTRNLLLAGVAIANGLVALSGALLAQYQGFADVQMGLGMLVWGLASVIIGEALVRTRRLGLA
ncbi:MAG TPA: ABC transporter permease, partial [Acidobacteriota bacterium]|nr:ABC transporter permease [Acidobacteriota bacterium]